MVTIGTKKATVRKNIPDFFEITGPCDEILSMENKFLLSLLLAFLSLLFMVTIVFQTNNALQKEKPYTTLDLSKFLKFLSMNLLMAIKKMPIYLDRGPPLISQLCKLSTRINLFYWFL